MAMNVIQYDEIPLSELPLHLQMAILEKMEFDDFITFKQSSHHALEMSSLVKVKLPWIISEINWKDFVVWYENVDITTESFKEMQLCIEYLTIDVLADDSVCEELSWAFSLIEARVDIVHVTKRACERGLLSASSLGEVCQAAKAARLQMESTALSKELFLQYSVQQMVEIAVDSGDHSKEDDFTVLKAIYVYLADLPDIPQTLQRFRVYFQQWAEGARQIGIFTAGWKGSTDVFVNYVLKNLQLERIWTPEIHRTTPLARLKLWKYSMSPNDQAFICYAENSPPLLISFLNNSIRVTQVKDIHCAYGCVFYFMKVYPPPLSLRGRMMRRAGAFFRRVRRL